MPLDGFRFWCWNSFGDFGGSLLRVGALGLVVTRAHNGCRHTGGERLAFVLHIFHASGNRRHSVGAFEPELKDVSVLVSSFAMVGGGANDLGQ